MIKRRYFLAASAVALVANRSAWPQQPAKKYRVADVQTTTPTSLMTENGATTQAAFFKEMRRLGYVEGENVLIDARWSDGNPERLAQDAEDFVRLKVDVIVAHGGIGGTVAKKATATIPIVVATASDFLGAGLVHSLAHPGGNVTGTNDQAAEIAVKEVELLAEIVPKLQRVGLLWDRSNPGLKNLAGNLAAEAARRKIVVMSLPVGRLEDFEKVINTAVRGRAQGIIVALGGLTLSNRARITQLCMGKHLPVVAASRLFTEAGALASYGADLPAVYKRAAIFVDKILRGTKVGLTIPPSLLLRADQVIQ